MQGRQLCNSAARIHPYIIDEGVDKNSSIIVEDIMQNIDEDFKQDVDEYVERNADENIERNADEDMEQMIDVGKVITNHEMTINNEANDNSIGDEKIVVVVDDDELGYDDNTEDGETQPILIQDEDSDENGDNFTNYENTIVKLEDVVEFDIGRERSSSFLPIEEKSMSCNFPDISTRNGIYMTRMPLKQELKRWPKSPKLFAIYVLLPVLHNVSYSHRSQNL